MNQKITIDSDDAELETLLRELETLVVRSGGYLHPRLRIVVAQGQLKVESDASGPDPLVRLPESCLLPIDDVDIGLRDDDSLSLASPPADMDAGKWAMLKCMIAIYNRGQKVRQYRHELPWLALAGSPALLALLHSARADAPKATQLYELAAAGELERLALRGFLGSRVLKYQPADGEPAQVMMPFIDFFNHHSASPSFGRDGDALTVRPSRPLAGSNECFVCYNALDTLDAFLNYGFVDVTAPFVRSVPLQIALPGIGSLRIRGKMAQPRKQPLPPQLKDLGVFLPRFRRLSDQELAAAQLLIPAAGRPDALHRVFVVLIQNLAPGLGLSELDDAVTSAVQQVLAANEDYYRQLETMRQTTGTTVESAPALEQLGVLVDVQQRKLAAYRDVISHSRFRGPSGDAPPPGMREGMAWS